MTVGQLIAELQKYPADQGVAIFDDNEGMCLCIRSVYSDEDEGPEVFLEVG